MSEYTAEEKEMLRQAIQENPDLVSDFFNDDVHGYPEAPDRDNLMKLFRTIIGLRDNSVAESSKVGNLNETELGRGVLPVRTYLNLARFCKSEGWGTVKDYLNAKALVTLHTSLSRKASLLTLAVTQRRVSKNLMPVTRETRSGMFSSQEKVVGDESEY